MMGVWERMSAALIQGAEQLCFFLSEWLVPGCSCPCSQFYMDAAQAERRVLHELEQFVCCGWYYRAYIRCSFLPDVVLVPNSYLDHPA